MLSDASEQVDILFSRFDILSTRSERVGKVGDFSLSSYQCRSCRNHSFCAYITLMKDILTDASMYLDISKKLSTDMMTLQTSLVPLTNVFTT